MLTQDEILFLNQFIMSRPLDGLNLIDAQKALQILSKLNKANETANKEV